VAGLPVDMVRIPYQVGGPGGVSGVHRESAKSTLDKKVYL